MHVRILSSGLAAAACLPLLLLASANRATLVEALIPSCAPHGFLSNDKLDCQGHCSSSRCKERPKEDETGPYFFCGCSSTEPTCCHLISRERPDGSRYEAVGGDCPSCPAPGACTLFGSGSSAQAACLDPND